MPHAAGNRTLKHGCIVMASGVGARFGGNKLMAELCDVPLVGYVVRATDGLFSRRVVVTRHADVAALCETLGVQVILHDEPCRNDTVRLGMEAMDGCDTVTFVQGDQPLIRPASIVALLRAAERDAAGAARRDAARRDAARRGVADVVGCDAVGAALADAAEDYAMGLDAAEDYAMGLDAVECDVDAAAGCDAAESDVAGVAKHDAVGCNAAENGVARIWRTSFDGVPGAPVLFPSWAFDELRSLPRGKGGGFVAKAHAEYVRTIEVSSEWELFDVDTRDDLEQLQTHVARCGSASLPR